MKNYINSFPSSYRCPVCGTNKNEKTLVVPIPGTKEYIFVHRRCICKHLLYNADVRMFYAVAATLEKQASTLTIDNLNGKTTDENNKQTNE